MENDATVFVVDDDDGVRQAVGFLLRAANLSVRLFDSAVDFLDSYEPECAGCLVLDLQMPGMDGLSLQAALQDRDIQLPIVFLTGHGDVPAAVQAIQGGAVDFLEKPFDSERLLRCIKRALEADSEAREHTRQIEKINEKLSLLTDREKEVFHRVVAGEANKVIAIDLGISERTVEIHRSRVMRKLGARNLADLIRFIPGDS